MQQWLLRVHCQPAIHKHRMEATLLIAIDCDVFWFNVTMEETLPMHVSHSICDLPKQLLGHVVLETTIWLPTLKVMQVLWTTIGKADVQCVFGV